MSSEGQMFESMMSNRKEMPSLSESEKGYMIREIVRTPKRPGLRPVRESARISLLLMAACALIGVLYLTYVDRDSGAQTTFRTDPSRFVNRNALDYADYMDYNEAHIAGENIESNPEPVIQNDGEETVQPDNGKEAEVTYQAMISDDEEATEQDDEKEKRKKQQDELKEKKKSEKELKKKAKKLELEKKKREQELKKEARKREVEKKKITRKLELEKKKRARKRALLKRKQEREQKRRARKIELEKKNRKQYKKKQGSKNKKQVKKKKNANKKKTKKKADKQ